MDDPEQLGWVKAVALLAFVTLVAIVAYFGMRGAKAREALEAKAHEERVQRAIEQGLLNADGRPVCVACGAEAHHPGVITGRAWFDRLPIVARLNALYAMPWRYTVVPEYEGGLRLCGIHHRAAVQRLEQTHAAMRSEHAQFNANQQQKIAMLDQGGLVQLLREDSEEIKRSIGLRGVVRRSVETTPQAPYQLLGHDVHVLPLTTTAREDE